MADLSPHVGHVTLVKVEGEDAQAQAVGKPDRSKRRGGRALSVKRVGANLIDPRGGEVLSVEKVGAKKIA